MQTKILYIGRIFFNFQTKFRIFFRERREEGRGRMQSSSNLPLYLVVIFGSEDDCIAIEIDYRAIKIQ
jgi:hypothetical protein